jgi:hypothetical protein
MVPVWLKWVMVLLLVMFIFWMLKANPITVTRHIIHGINTTRNAIHSQGP